MAQKKAGANAPAFFAISSELAMAYFFTQSA
jgi:hypothetical protein